MAKWTAWISDRVKPDTAAHYVAQLRTVIPDGEPYLRAGFTAPAIATWLASRTALAQKRRKSTTAKSRRKEDPAPRSVTGATKRKYLAAVWSFATYLLEVGVLTTNMAQASRFPRR